MDHKEKDLSAPCECSNQAVSSSINHDETAANSYVDKSDALTEVEAPGVQNGDSCICDEDLYGLKGILRVVHTGDANVNIISLGTDLTTLGLDLNSPEPLFASFVSPLLDQQPPKEDIEFFLPPCYYMNPPSLKMTHLQKFTAETLFYMFYTIVGDTLQGFAAAELYNRGWVYHSNWRKWFITNTTQLDPQNASSATEEILRADAGWIYFEPAVWKKKTYIGEIDSSKFLKVEVLRDLLDEQKQQHGFLGDPPQFPSEAPPTCQETRRPPQAAAATAAAALETTHSTSIDSGGGGTHSSLGENTRSRTNHNRIII